MTPGKAFFIGALASAALASCGGDAGHADDVEVFSSLDVTQCGGVGRPLSTLKEKLLAGGVDVAASSCGSDGMVYSAVCGGMDGSIGIFTIPASQEATAEALGFGPLKNLPSASEAPCPVGGS